MPSSLVCFVGLMLFSVGACLMFVANTECKISLLCSMDIHTSVTKCDACAANHMIRFTRQEHRQLLRSGGGGGGGLAARIKFVAHNESRIHIFEHF